MDKHAVTVLEFKKVLASVAAYNAYPQTGRILDESAVLSDREGIRILHSVVHSLIRIFDSEMAYPYGIFPDIIQFKEFLSVKGAVLEVEQLHDIANFISSALDLFSYIEEGSKLIEKPLETRLANYHPLHGVKDKIRTYIDKDGMLREKHIPSLVSLGKKIRNAKNEIDRISKNYLREDQTRQLFRNEVATQREGRTVLPLKSNYKGQVKGIVHNTSASGQTVYVEPFELVEQNNDLCELENKYRQEVFRICKELSTTITRQADMVYDCEEHLVYWDAMLSRARYARQEQCVFPGLDGTAVQLYSARHPLLGKGAVPVDVILDENKCMMIITGPNTGGKTVTLKTIGLFALMSQFGLGIPAEEGSTLRVFSNVFADIGDEQSIEDSLSTFSGHMKNIGYFEKHADENSLVLLDELGSGTDPVEGAAIAMALLDELLERKTTVFATTHHSSLKNYGFSRTRIENASVSFDTDSLRPTYKILTGVPGESHGVDIAEANGLSSAIVSKARAYISEGLTDTSTLINELIEKQKQLEERELSLSISEKELLKSREELQEKIDKVRSKEFELHSAGLKDFDDVISNGRKTIENLVRKIREGELSRDKIIEAKEEVSRLESRAERLKDRNLEMKSGVNKSRKVSLKEGMRVYAAAFRKEGTILRKEKKGKWLVSFGNMKMSIQADKLEAVDSGPEKADYTYSNSMEYESLKPARELDVRGSRLEEALETVKRQIEAALVNDIKEFGIIHGMGEGVLQKGIRDYLDTESHVKHHEFAKPDDGGFGKTIVLLR